jgi:hypothetical protein
MKKLRDISCVESNAVFRTSLVEKFVQENLPPPVIKKNRITGMGKFGHRYCEIECCAAETPVIGTIEIFFTPDLFDPLPSVSIPAISRFFVFCIRDNQRDYKVACSSSLS